MDAPEALREFLAYVVANLIEHPKQASIASGHNAQGTLVFRIQLAPDDVRQVMGKNGMTASAIRSLLNAAAAKHGIKASLKIGTARDADMDSEAAEDAGKGQEDAAAPADPAAI